eukprot:CAMPEP_0169147100 /NCGR_PEP_ID=MMETSP1015-20121227/48006_1 /TAXON_ID=342587 /ORGANISM="Karlodinium micrum, Strain CCMP2283" /LENGTH=59 /DNA_ID=CAMNT_0009215217 /DNA_START=112 /DNA_END=291 /DNA_ORIENTATION=-
MKHAARIAGGSTAKCRSLLANSMSLANFATSGLIPGADASGAAQVLVAPMAQMLLFLDS